MQHTGYPRSALDDLMAARAKCEEARARFAATKPNSRARNVARDAVQFWESRAAVLAAKAAVPA